MDSEKAYCRLCAIKIPTDKLIDLKLDEEKLALVVEQLAQVNITMDFDLKIFPNTACFVCLEQLERTSRFMKDIERAQITLCGIYLVKEVKNETVIDTAMDHILNPMNDNQSDECKTDATPMADASYFSDTSYTKGNDDRSLFDAQNKDYSCPSSSIKQLETAGKKKPPKNSLKKNVTKSKSTVQALAPQPPLSSWADYHWDCACCNAQFNTIDKIKTHSIENHFCCNGYKCTDCGQRGFYQDLFLKHIRLHHTALQYRCHRCEQNFTTSRNLYVHDCPMMTDKDKQYLCPGCNIRFDTIPELEAHINKYFIKPKQSKKGKYLCNICQKYFKTKAIFTAHKKIHNKKYKELICDQCGKTFSNKTSIACHVLLHLENRPYSCDICKLTFKLKIFLSQHIKNLHSTQEQFGCDVCGKKFKCKLYLKKHKMIHQVLKKYACNYCGKKFLRNHALKVHIRQHTGDRPYCCQYCGKTFVNAANYNKHKKRKH